MSHGTFLLSKFIITGFLVSPRADERTGDWLWSVSGYGKVGLWQAHFSLCVARSDIGTAESSLQKAWCLSPDLHLSVWNEDSQPCWNSAVGRSFESCVSQQCTWCLHRSCSQTKAKEKVLEQVQRKSEEMLFVAERSLAWESEVRVVLHLHL